MCDFRRRVSSMPRERHSVIQVSLKVFLNLFFFSFYGAGRSLIEEWENASRFQSHFVPIETRTPRTISNPLPRAEEPPRAKLLQRFAGQMHSTDTSARPTPVVRRGRSIAKLRVEHYVQRADTSLQLKASPVTHRLSPIDVVCFWRCTCARAGASVSKRAVVARGVER